MINSTKKVFISYSWAVQEKVVELADRLINNGVDVIIDVYDLREGHDKYAFMEQSINDETVDKVLIICDKTYTLKADNRAGGVGDETVIITPEVYGKTDQERFIPVIFEVDEDAKAYCPIYLKSKIYFDLSTEDDKYELEYEKLLRNIYEKPLFKKPTLGPMPEWLEQDTVNLSGINDIIKQVKGHTRGNDGKAAFLLRKAVDCFVECAKQYELPKDVPVEKGLLTAINQTKPFRDSAIQYGEALMYSSFPVASNLSLLIERLYNDLHDAADKQRYQNSDFELYDYMIWELFISFTTLLLHYEKYKELHDFVKHTFFFKEGYFNENVKAVSYFELKHHFSTIEGICKKKSEEPTLLTLAGKTLINRESKPILTRNSLVNADLVLYQLGKALDIGNDQYNYWFPLTYIYQKGPQIIWQKLKSKKHCKQILPLFGIDNLDSLKNILKECTPNRDMRYQHSFDNARHILSSIKFEEIGTLP